ADIELAAAIFHRQHHHHVLIAATDLHGFARLAGEFVHFLGGGAEQIEAEGAAQAVVVGALPEPDLALAYAVEQVVGHQIVDDGIDGGKRRADGAGDFIGGAGLFDLLQIVENLQRAVDTAGAGPADRLGLALDIGHRLAPAAHLGSVPSTLSVEPVQYRG